MREEWRSAVENQYRTDFASWWGNAFDSEVGHAVTVIGPSTYLLDVDDTRIVIDPTFRFPWIQELVASRWKTDLAAADAVLFTHTHGDHYDANMVLELCDTPANLIIPDFFNGTQLLDGGYPKSKLSFASEGLSFTVGNLRITPFESAHTRVEAKEHYPEYGYCIETSRGTLIFPCDVRNYDPALIPALPQADWLFLHIWLGGENSQNLPCEPYLYYFTRYALHFHAPHISFAHLYEIGRTPDEMWTYTHAGLCADAILAEAPHTDIRIPRPGERIEL